MAGVGASDLHDVMPAGNGSGLGGAVVRRVGRMLFVPALAKGSDQIGYCRPLDACVQVVGRGWGWR